MKIGLFVGSAPMDLATPEKTVVDVDVKWGAPSEAPVSYRLGDVECFVIRRHGQHGDINPHSINYRANVWQMVALGVESPMFCELYGADGSKEPTNAELDVLRDVFCGCTCLFLVNIFCKIMFLHGCC